jgi:hypothetical protein
MGKVHPNPKRSLALSTYRHPAMETTYRHLAKSDAAFIAACIGARREAERPAVLKVVPSTWSSARPVEGGNKIDKYGTEI